MDDYTLGLIWSLFISPANLHDTEGGVVALCKLPSSMKRLRKIVVDQGYQGKAFSNTVNEITKAEVEVVKRLGDGFKVLPKRWIVERTFAWFEGWRRLTKDFEKITKYSESVVYLSMIKLMLNRLSYS